MNKKFFGGITILAITTVIMMNLNLNAKHNYLLDISLANVEAEASCEITKGDKVVLKCSGPGTCSTKYLGYTLTCDGTKN